MPRHWMAFAQLVNYYIIRSRTSAECSCCRSVSCKMTGQRLVRRRSGYKPWLGWLHPMKGAFNAQAAASVAGEARLQPPTGCFTKSVTKRGLCTTVNPNTTGSLSAMASSIKGGAVHLQHKSMDLLVAVCIKTYVSQGSCFACVA